MFSYVLRRLIHGIVSIIGASILIFVISRMTGDPIVLLLPVDAPQALIDQTRETMGLDKPVWMQYLIFAGKALSGDFGNSYRWQMPALTLVLDRLPSTIQLALSALLFSTALAVPLGVLSAVHRGGWIDSIGKGFAMLGQAMPGFWVGLLLILIFSVELNWFPAFGAGGISHIILPAIALGWYPVAAQTRIIRSAMLDVLESEQLGTQALELGELFRRRLRSELAEFDMVKEVRGMGLLNGIEFMPPKTLAFRALFEAFNKIHPAMFGQILVMRMFREKSILTQICGNNFMVLKAAPPLTVTPEQLDEFVTAIRDVVEMAQTSLAFWTEALAMVRRSVNV